MKQFPLFCQSLTNQMKITLRLNHGAPEVHKSWLIFLFFIFFGLCLIASTQEPGDLDMKSPRPRAWPFKEQRFHSLQSANLKGKQTAVLQSKLLVFGELRAPESGGGGGKRERGGEREREGEREGEREREHPRKKRRHMWGQFLPDCQLNSRIKTNNHTSQQNANLELMQENTELSAKQPAVENPDVLHSRALLGCSFTFKMAV